MLPHCGHTASQHVHLLTRPALMPLGPSLLADGIATALALQSVVERSVHPVKLLAMYDMCGPHGTAIACYSAFFYVARSVQSTENGTCGVARTANDLCRDRLTCLQESLNGDSQKEMAVPCKFFHDNDLHLYTAFPVNVMLLVCGKIGCSRCWRPLFDDDDTGRDRHRLASQ